MPGNETGGHEGTTVTHPTGSGDRSQPAARRPLAKLVLLATLLAVGAAAAGCGAAEPAPTRPPGGWIAYVRSDPGGAGGIYVLDPARSFDRRISTTIGPGLDWSPDGQRLVFTSNPGIAIMQADGSAVTQLAQKGEEPSWSPDGTRIVFSIRPNEPPGDEPPDQQEIDRFKQTHIHVIQVDGSGLTPLTGGTFADDWPTWSSDGQLIAFARSPLALIPPDGCGGGLCVMHADGSAMTALPVDGAHPAWAPDGSRIAYALSYTDEMGIWVAGPDGLAPVNLTRELSAGPEAEFSYPAWSPDGARIAFAYRPRGEPGDLFVVDRDGTNLTRLTTGVGNVWGITWG